MSLGDNLTKNEIDAILKRELPNLERQDTQETVGYGGEQKITWLYKHINREERDFGVFFRITFEWEEKRVRTRIGLIIDGEVDEKSHFRDDCNYISELVLLGNIETFKAIARI